MTNPELSNTLGHRDYLELTIRAAVLEVKQEEDKFLACFKTMQEQAGTFAQTMNSLEIPGDTVIRARLIGTTIFGRDRLESISSTEAWTLDRGRKYGKRAHLMHRGYLQTMAVTQEGELTIVTRKPDSLTILNDYTEPDNFLNRQSFVGPNAGEIAEQILGEWVQDQQKAADCYARKK